MLTDSLYSLLQHQSLHGLEVGLVLSVHKSHQQQNVSSYMLYVFKNKKQTVQTNATVNSPEFGYFLSEQSE